MNENINAKKEGIKIGHFHQTVINIITQFEKDIKHIFNVFKNAKEYGSILCRLR